MGFGNARARATQLRRAERSPADTLELSRGICPHLSKKPIEPPRAHSAGPLNVAQRLRRQLCSRRHEHQMPIEMDEGAVLLARDDMPAAAREHFYQLFARYRLLRRGCGKPLGRHRTSDLV
jgi:hypothetical protein